MVAPDRRYAYRIVERASCFEHDRVRLCKVADNQLALSSLESFLLDTIMVRQQYHSQRESDGSNGNSRNNEPLHALPFA